MSATTLRSAPRRAVIGQLALPTIIPFTGLAVYGALTIMWLFCG